MVNNVDTSSMKIITLREVQMLMLQAIKYVDMICRKEGITYFAAYGTLLGAVREHGFIAWDDDADLWMTRENYNKFCEAVKKYPDSRFFFQNTHTDSGFFLPLLGRVCINGTMRWPLEYAGADFHTGQFVDIFPLDYAFADPLQNKRRRKLTLFLHNHVMYKTIQKFHGRTIRSLIFNAVVKSCPLRFWNKLYDMLISSSSNPDKSTLINFGIDEAFPAQAFDVITELPFEDMMLPCPAGYDEVLRIRYGDDYMTPMIRGMAVVRIEKNSPLLAQEGSA